MSPSAIVVVSIVFALFFAVNTRSVLNPGTLFLGYWAVIVFFAGLQLFELKTAHQNTYNVIALGILGYVAGSLIGIMFKKYSFVFKQHSITGNINKSRKALGEYTINYRLAYFFFAVIIIFCLVRLKVLISLLAGGASWWELRLMSSIGDTGEGSLKGDTLMQLLYYFVVSPIIYLLGPTVIVEIFIGERNRKFIIGSFVCIALYTIVTVSRASLAFMIIYAGLTYLMFSKQQGWELPKAAKRILKLVPIFIVVLFLLIVYISKLRNSESRILINAYTYITGAVPLLDIHLSEALANSRTYGMLTFNGFLHPILFVLNYTHIYRFPATFDTVNEILANLETFHPLGKGIWMNAYATLFYDFYIDFGMVGVFVLSGLFGLICMRVYRNMKKHFDLRTYIAYLILCQYIFFSMARMYTVLATRALSFFWLFILLTHERNQHKSKKIV